MLNDLISKENLNYFMAIDFVVDWMRIFAYFLIVRDISKILLTLYEMLFDTLSFVFLLVCYLIIMGSIFSTLY